MRSIILVLAVLAAGVSPAWAQIYSWRDADGLLVVSDRPATTRAP
ncbi:MAG: DUF4124 domain-containing protein [Vicinamibacterales bacterium]